MKKISILTSLFAVLFATSVLASPPPPPASLKQKPKQKTTLPSRAQSKAAVVLPAYPGAIPLKMKTASAADAAGHEGEAAVATEATKGKNQQAFATNDSWEKISAFYNAQLSKQGFSKAFEQPIPNSGQLASFMRGMENVSVQYYENKKQYKDNFVDGDKVPEGKKAVVVTALQPN